MRPETTPEARTTLGFAATALPLMLLLGCTASDGDPEPTADDSANVALVREYVQAVGGGDAERVAALAVYPAPPDLDLVDARDLPAACVDAEIDTLTAAGVTADSSVELSWVGGSDDVAEGSDEVVPHSITLALIGLPDGDQVGRGIMSFDGTDRVQIEPSDACDAALASAP